MRKFDLVSEGIIRRLQKRLRRNISKSKFRHSVRVSNRLDFAPKYVKIAALFHDYLERGGDLGWLKRNVSKKTVKLVQALTAKGDPLSHMIHVIDSMEPGDERNFLILIKLSDRVDNFKKRLALNDLTEKYKNKTRTLIKFLELSYTGDRDLYDELRVEINI